MISTSRLLIRDLSEKDHSAFSRLESDPRGKQFTGAPSGISLDRYKRFISTPTTSCMALCTKDDGRFIGRCGFREAEGRIELEIFLLPEEQGHGFGPEIFDEMISHCSIAFPSLKVAATASLANDRAVKLLVNRDFRDTGETVLLKSGVKQSVYVKFS